MDKYVSKANKYFLDLMLKDKSIYYHNDLISDSYFICNLEKCFCLNKEKIKEVTTLDSFFEITEDIQDIKTWYSKEDIITIIDLGNNKHCISKKYFNIFLGCEIKILNKETDKGRNPILFYSDDKLVGFVLPIKVY